MERRWFTLEPDAFQLNDAPQLPDAAFSVQDCSGRSSSHQVGSSRDLGRFLPVTQPVICINAV